MSTTCPACIAAEKARLASLTATHIHEVSPGRWIVAEQRGPGRWEAPVSCRANLGSVSAVYAPSLAALARDGAVHVYRSKAAAVRASKIGDDAESAMCRPCERRIEAEMAAYDDDRARREREMYGY